MADVTVVIISGTITIYLYINIYTSSFLFYHSLIYMGIMKSQISQENVLMQKLNKFFAETDIWICRLDYQADESIFLTRFVEKYLKDVNKEIDERIGQFQQSLFELDKKRHAVVVEVENYRQTLELLKNEGTGEEGHVTLFHENLRAKYCDVVKLQQEIEDEIYETAQDM